MDEKRCILDIEANNLLTPALDYLKMPFRLKETFRVWCVVIRDLDTNAVFSFSPSELSAENLKACLDNYDEVIGHNIISYDLPVLKLYGLLDYSIGYPGQDSYLNSKVCVFTDTLLWSKLLNADRLGGHSLAAWGKRLGNYKGDFTDWTQYSAEMLEYCIQDTAVNADIYHALIKEIGNYDCTKAYNMEIKLADLTLKQEVFGFAFDSKLAHENLAELTTIMQGIAKLIDPLLPPKKLGKTAIKHYTPPAKQFKQNGEMTSHMEKFIVKHAMKYYAAVNEVEYEGKFLELPLTAPIKTEEVANIEDIEVVKGYLLDLGWEPTEVKERDLVKKADKTTRNLKELVEAIDRYVEQTSNSLFKNLRCEILGCTFEGLRDTLTARINGTKPIYVPTSPKIAVGLEKEMCPSLVRLGEKAEFAREAIKYYTYRHRKNSIAGGGFVEEDDEDSEEPSTGFLSYVREDGRISTPADILGANTGRYRHKIVCNIPRVTSLYGDKMRGMFGAGEGLYQLGFDFASLEARVMGHYVIGKPSRPYTEGRALAEALVAEKPNDIHSINAKKLGIDRNSAKSFSYASIYGAQPTKLAKMLGISESKSKQLFNDYWDAVPALKELKADLEVYWKTTGNKYIPGLDGRRLVTRSKHSLINVLFQSGGAIVAKWSIVRIAQLFEELDLLGDPFLHDKTMLKVWAMIAMHDEMQYACHPKLLNIKPFPDEETAKAALEPGCSAIGHGKKGPYVGYRVPAVDCIEKGIQQACIELKTRTDMGFEWAVGRNWKETH